MYGTVIKTLREKKGLKPYDVYHGVVNKSTYWKIENKNSYTSFPILLQLLNKMNVSVEEFIHTLHLHLPELNQRIFLEKEIALNQLDVPTLLDLKEKFMVLYTKEKTLSYYHAYCEISLKLCRLQNKSEPLFAKVLHEYLFQCEYWTYYEIQLFSNIMYSFDYTAISFLITRAFRGIHNYPDFPRSWEEESKLLLNFLDLAMQNGDEKGIDLVAKFFLGKFPMIDNNNLSIRVLRKWAQNVILYFRTKDENYLSVANQAIQAFSAFDLDNLYDKYHAREITYLEMFSNGCGSWS